MIGTKVRLGPGGRIGDYIVEHELSGGLGFIAFSATHTLLPRRARIVALDPSSIERGRTPAPRAKPVGPHPPDSLCSSIALGGGQSLARLLLREACLLEALRHPGVPRVYECGLDAERRPWIAMELIEGPTLAFALATGPRSVPDVLALLAEVGEILHHAHTRGVVHGNLRPGAIALRREGACIIDWADARSHDTADVPLPASALAYQSPEVLAGGVTDRRSDIFALGAIAYEALSGAPADAPAADRFPGAPRALTALLDRMLAVDPVVRPSSAEVRAAALAVVEHIDVPMSGGADEDGVDVQVEDVHLESDTAIELDGEPISVPARDLKLRWTPPDAYHRSPTEKMPALSDARDILLSRTKTDPELVLFDSSGRKIS